jgi:hypothetical protein
MPCLEWRYGAKILLAVATTLASWFVVMISESATRGSLLSLLDRGFFAFVCSGFLVDAPLDLMPLQGQTSLFPHSLFVVDRLLPLKC